jgi:hypothetical protein
LFARLASAAALLQPAWGAQAAVVNADIRGWLAAQPDRSAGVVVAAGVLHCFVDPVAVVLELARVADHAVVIEANHPVGLLAAHDQSCAHARACAHVRTFACCTHAHAANCLCRNGRIKCLGRPVPSNQTPI